MLGENEFGKKCTITFPDGTSETFNEFLFLGFKDLDHYRSPEMLVITPDTRVIPIVQMKGGTPDVLAALLRAAEDLQEQLLKRLPLDIACEILSDMESIRFKAKVGEHAVIEVRRPDIGGN